MRGYSADASSRGPRHLSPEACRSASPMVTDARARGPDVVSGRFCNWRTQGTDLPADLGRPFDAQNLDVAAPKEPTEANPCPLRSTSGSTTGYHRLQQRVATPNATTHSLATQETCAPQTFPYLPSARTARLRSVMPTGTRPTRGHCPFTAKRSQFLPLP